ncbi:hypothetical protein ACJROX_27205 [Pseudalkalibacillus sp. A8]|uniref:hypothetical protein n=1 Tax=Pseudalkalibacillus sp. A8 TaxID=3382641 RepID=UPI0038B5DDF4
MKFSTYDWDSLRVEYNFAGKPYHLSFVCVVEETPCLFQIRKEESWEVHYVAHASETCEHCGTVRLYTTCDVFSTLLKGKEQLLFQWVRKQQQGRGE